MPIAIVNHRYFNGAEIEGSVPDTADVIAAAYNATIDIVNGADPSGQAHARTAEASGLAFGAFAGGEAAISHGEQLPPLSFDAASVIGPSGTLTEWSASTTLSGTQTITDRSFTNKGITIQAGANITFENCRIIGNLGQTSYTIKVIAGGECQVTLLDCEVIARSTTSQTPRCLAMWGTGNVRAERTIFRGGIDNVFLNPDNTPGLFSTGDPLVPDARGWFVNCWFGDYQRVGNSHSDAAQIDGGGYVLFDACRMMGYTLDTGADPLTTWITDPLTDGLGAGVILATQNSGAPKRISNVAVRRCWAEGGNYTVDLSPPDGIPVTLTAVTDSKFGRRFRYAPLRGGTANSNNVWGQSGPSGPDLTGAVVTAGQPI